MLRNVFAILSIALVGSRAINAAEGPSTTSTISALAATHTVSVGAQGLNFSPNQLNASVGDIIEYRFYPQNHSVARAAFGNQPCIPYELSGPGRVGFWSGFEPTQVVSNDLPAFRLRVNDTDPFFFYCSSPGACLQGMIGVNSTFSYEAQFGNTQKATLMLSPGETFPKEEASSSSIIRTTTATGASTTPTSPPAATNSLHVVPAEHSHSLSTGAIVGIAIGAVVVLILGAALAWMCGRQRTVKEIMRQSQQPVVPLNPNNHNSYQASMAGISDAKYSNMQKLPLSGPNSPGYVYGTPMMDQHSYRSASPPIDERTQMMGMERAIHPTHYQGGHQSNNSLPNTPGFPSPAYSHEMEHSGMAPTAVGMRPYNPDEMRPPTSSGPHEMAVPSPNTPERAPSTGNPPRRMADESRPFSFTGSESGYRSDENDVSLH